MLARKLFYSGSKNNHIYLKITGDKYFATRTIILASISDGTLILLNCPEHSSDIKSCLNFPVIIGAPVIKINGSILITGTSGKLPTKFSIFCGDSGTLTRFILSIGVLFKKEIQLVLGENMKKRPLIPFLTDLKNLGGNYQIENNTLTISGTKNSYTSYNLTSRIISSQFISGVTIFGGLLTRSIKIKIRYPESVSKTYLKLTQKCMSLFGGKTTEKQGSLIVFPANYKNNKIITIPEDPSSTVYLIVISILLKWRIYFNFTKRKFEIGEWKIIHILKKMGCTVEIYKTNFSVYLTGELQAITEDLKNFPDNAPTVLFLCSLTTGISKIYNIPHLEYKESNRLGAMKEFFSKINIKTKEKNDQLHIYGNPNFLKKDLRKKSFISTFFLDAKHDHRISIIFLTASIIFPNLWIKNFKGIEKSFPDFWSILKELNIKYLDKNFDKLGGTQI